MHLRASPASTLPSSFNTHTAGALRKGTQPVGHPWRHTKLKCEPQGKLPFRLRPSPLLSEAWSSASAPEAARGTRAESDKHDDANSSRCVRTETRARTHSTVPKRPHPHPDSRPYSAETEDTKQFPTQTRKTPPSAIASPGHRKLLCFRRGGPWEM